MSEIETPDEDGGIEPTTNVSFIVIPAKKGIQAAAVTIADPPIEEKENEKPLEKAFADIGFGNDDGFGSDDKAGESNAAADEGWPDDKAITGENTAPAADDGWPDF